MAKRRENNIVNEKKGLTLIELLVGIFLLAIVFLGLTAAYRLSLKVIGLSQNKITATGIMNEQMEKIRNLEYGSVGTVGAVLPAAAGMLDHTAEKNINSADYTITTEVKYVVDPGDGTGPGDTCNWDYKLATVRVSWGGSFSGSVAASTIVAPKNLSQEIQSCTNQPGGIVTARAFDGSMNLIAEPLLEILDPATNAVITSATPTGGEYSFALPVGSYRVRASKANYGISRSYSYSEMTAPDVADPLVPNGGEEQKSLLIDKLGALAVDGLSVTGQGFFSDTFDDAVKISELSAAEVIEGGVSLSGTPYSGTGTVVSSDIAPGDLVQWNEFTFVHDLPASTGIIYQILYFNGASWILIPDSHLAGNSSGFSSSPVNLSVLDAAVYSLIKIKATLSTTDDAETPKINNWQISWVADEGVPVPGFAFHIRGNKTVGKNSGEFVYKYDNNLVLDGNGHLDVPDAEADSYTFSVGITSPLALAGTDPAAQPINVPAEGSVAVKLYLQSQNSLLVTVQNADSLVFLPAAIVRLSNAGMGYDKTQYTDSNGQTQFLPLNNGTYTLDVQMQGFGGYGGSVNVQGNSVKTVQLDLID